MGSRIGRIRNHVRYDDGYGSAEDMMAWLLVDGVLLLCFRRIT